MKSYLDSFLTATPRYWYVRNVPLSLRRISVLTPGLEGLITNKMLYNLVVSRKTTKEGLRLAKPDQLRLSYVLTSPSHSAPDGLHCGVFTSDRLA